MEIIIVGGTWGETPRESSIVNKLAEYLEPTITLSGKVEEMREQLNNAPKIMMHNGGSIEKLEEIAKTIPQYDLILWMPDMSNEVEEITFRKKLGSVLIVSKVLRENRTRIDAVTRIFKYGGNAVIAITRNDEKLFNFELIDALDNTWVNNSHLGDLTLAIYGLTKWTNEAKRAGTLKMANPLDKVIEFNKRVADSSAEQNIRYFGNLSTRCTKMFPSFRTEEESYYVSARNTDKNRLSSDDMVQTTIVNNKIRYFGNRKPSVDTPVQVELYKRLPYVNFFIHGHAFVKDAPTTEHYYPCGDLREVEEIVKLIDFQCGVINLKNHGFLIYASTLEELDELTSNLIFDTKE